jgi:hypothetical protein
MMWLDEGELEEEGDEELAFSRRVSPFSHVIDYYVGAMHVVL